MKIDCTPNLPTNIVDFRGLDSSIMLIQRGGILMSIGNLPESLSRAMLVGTMLVGGLGDSRNWEERFYKPPPPGSCLGDCDCTRFETNASIHHPLWLVVVYRIGLPRNTCEGQEVRQQRAPLIGGP